MSFPLSPTNGQTAVLNGITYSYSSASTLWTRVVGAVPNTRKSTSSATPPASPSIGDEWYNTTTDDIYRYTSDGTTSYWLDTTGASTTVTTGAASALVVSQPTYAVSFNGTSQYLSVPTSSAFNFSTGDFTIECWVNISVTGISHCILSSFPATTSPNGFELLVNTTNYIVLDTWSYPTEQAITATSNPLVINTWNHVVVSKASGTFRIFVNGISCTFSGSSSQAIDGSTGVTITVGFSKATSFSHYLNGYISNLRVVKGTAVYTAAFAVPSAPLTAVTNTVLLTCQSVPVTDASTSSSTVTNVANASLAIYAAPTVSYANQTLYYRLNTDLVGANVATVQSVLGVGATLTGNTVYQFEAVYALSKSAGTTSHTIGVGFGGTATLNNIGYSLQGLFKSTGFTGVTVPDVMEYIQTTATTVVTLATTGASVQFIGVLKGTVSINAGGTFIPQYTLSAAPGGAYTTAIGSYITLTPIGRAGSNSSLGTWA
jgi:hypothetical protein